MAQDPIQLPIELVDLIASFALDSVRDPDHPTASVSADATEAARAALLNRLRLVCHEWARHFFCRGLFRRFTFKDDDHFREAMELWSLSDINTTSTRSRVSAFQPRVPIIQELTLSNLRNQESIPARNTRAKKRFQPHLSMSTAVRIIELFAHNLTHLHINFANSLYFPQSLIDAASKTSRFASLTLSISFDGSPPGPAHPPEATGMHPETMFEFLAAVPKLSQLTLLNWDIPYPFECSSQIASHHITHLTLRGPHALDVDYLLDLSDLFVPSIKTMCLDVAAMHLDEFAEVVADAGETLEALSILTVQLFDLTHVLGETPLPMLKVLQVDYLHFVLMSTWPEAIQKVETLAVGIKWFLRRAQCDNTTPEHVALRLMISNFPKLKRLVIIDPDNEVTNDCQAKYFSFESLEVTLVESCDIFELMDLNRSPLNQSRRIHNA